MESNLLTLEKRVEAIEVQLRPQPKDPSGWGIMLPTGVAQVTMGQALSNMMKMIEMHQEFIGWLVAEHNALKHQLKFYERGNHGAH